MAKNLVMFALGAVFGAGFFYVLLLLAWRLP
jgi:hypothetical protein